MGVCECQVVLNTAWGLTEMNTRMEAGFNCGVATSTTLFNAGLPFGLDKCVQRPMLAQHQCASSSMAIMLSTVPNCSCGLVLITQAKQMWRHRVGSGLYLDPVGVKH